ncbi:MAG: hypothetical protein KGJ60_00410 [Verrucomicrobiota bacterium]|nr:hypothetical protein [Verrucomicrobiota bacterium]
MEVASTMTGRARKFILLLLAAVLLAGGSQVQKSLNSDRQQLGLTRAAPLKDAPPLLAFTTVALGGFRGLISNFLWIRANDLQLEDKYFEMVQLADWITDLEPHFAQVWAFEAWNMAWNISVKFKENGPGDYSDRWRWVQAGMRLLRDKALKYNPDNALLYQQLAWIFQSKLGQNMDDADMYYKKEWAEEMTPFFGPHGTNYEQLIHPQTAEARTNALRLHEEFKLDPQYVKHVDEEWGPFDWRLPEASAIYWAAKGLEQAEAHPGMNKAFDVMSLRRVIFQSMLQTFHHGHIIADPFEHTYALAPNLDIIPKVNEAYETMYAQESDPGQKNGILTAQRNFLRDAVYYLYQDNRIAQAQKWFQYLAQKFPDKPIIDGDPNSLPRNLTLDQYAVACVQENINQTSQDEVTAAVQGLLARSYYNLAIGQDARADGFKRLAIKVYQNYNANIGPLAATRERIPLPPFDQINRMVVNRLLSPQQPMLSYAARAVLRTQLGLPAETNAPPPATTPAPTNAPPAAASKP